MLEPIKQWYIDIMDRNGDTIKEDYITCTYSEAVEQAKWLMITACNSDKYSIRAVDEI